MPSLIALQCSLLQVSWTSDAAEAPAAETPVGTTPIQKQSAAFLSALTSAPEEKQIQNLHFVHA